MLGVSLALACSGGDGPSESTMLEARAARLSQSLTDTTQAEADKPIARWQLPPELAEISGLALTPDQRLFAHNDETGRITEIDYRRGTVVKSFVVEETGDFEGLTYAGDHFIMMASNGVLYEFQEGDDGERVDCSTIDTHLGKECEFEGIAYDAGADAVILACKNVGDKKLKDAVVLYHYPLADAGGGKARMQVIPFSELIGQHEWKDLRPTDIAIDPDTGNYVIVSTRKNAIVEFTPNGEPVMARELDQRHPQPEGVAITRDKILIISDEASNAAASITLYRWQ